MPASQAQPLVSSRKRKFPAPLEGAVAPVAPKPVGQDCQEIEGALEEALGSADVQGGASRADVKRVAERCLGWSPGALDEHDAFVKAFVNTRLAEMEMVDVGELSGVAPGRSPACAASAEAESDSTTLRRVPAAALRHSISPNIAFFMAGAASSRKSSLLQRTVQYMVAADGAPACMQERQVFNVESTPKGIRVSLYAHMRCATISDEIVNTFPTPWSDKATTTHFLSRSKANTYTQCEPDDVLTAAGTIHLEEYTYQLKCAGQWEAVEWVLKPTPNGFQKRLTFTFAPDSSPQNDAQDAAMSEGAVARAACVDVQVAH